MFCSLTGFTLLITIISTFVVRTVNVIEYSPSYIKFSQLNNRYQNALNCPCKKIGIAYNTFVNIHVTFHQVCSSQFIEQTWIDMIYPEQTNSSSDDFRRTLSFFWQAIAGFCLISRRTWNDTMAGFYASHIFSPTVDTEQGIHAQVQATLNDRIDSARITLNRNLLAIRKITSANQMVSALATNFFLQYPLDDSDFTNSPMMTSRTINNCFCLNIQGCPHPASFTDDQNHTISILGTIADCLMVH